MEVPEPRGLSVLWYSLLVVGMRILHHASPGWTTYTSRHTPLPEHSVLWYSILVRHVGGVPLIGTATVLCLLPMEPMVPHLLRYPTDTCATRTPSMSPYGCGIPCGLYAVSRTSFRPPHYYPGLVSLSCYGAMHLHARYISGTPYLVLCCYGSQDHSTPVRTSGTGMTGYPSQDTT